MTGYLGFVLIGWNSVLIPSLIRSVEHAFRQTDAAFALFYFLSALVYALAAFAGGFLTERLGRRIVLASGAVILALGLLVEAVTPSWAVLLVAMIPVNWGAGIIDGGVNGLFLDIFRQARGGALSLLHVFFSVGAFVGPLVMGLLLGVGLSWRLLPLLTAMLALPVIILLTSRAMPTGKPTGSMAHAGDVVDVSDGASLAPFACLATAIGFAVAAEMGISSWVVRLLVTAPIATATGVLSVYWLGLAGGRLLSNRFAERFDYFTFTMSCILAGAVSLAAALFVPWLALEALLFAVCGLFMGPVYPMIVAIGGQLYPRRLARLSGALAAAAVVGSLVYPPLIGLMASTVGVRGGLLGAALLGVPEALAIGLARRTSQFGWRLEERV